MIVFGYAKDIAPINFIQLHINVTSDYILKRDRSNVKLHMTCISNIKASLHRGVERVSSFFLNQGRRFATCSSFFSTFKELRMLLPGKR